MDGYHFCGAAHNTRSGVTGGAAPEGETIMSVAAVPEKRENSRQFGIEPGNPGQGGSTIAADPTAGFGWPVAGSHT